MYDMTEYLTNIMLFNDYSIIQRDFGVYVVNMFDTGQATRVLKNARFSLAHLLKRTVDVDADKQCVNSKHAMHTTHTRALTF